MTKLIIVESPAKVKKLAAWLGKDWRVEASFGHVRDLPKDELGIDLADGFRPDYRVLPMKANIVRRLTRAVREAEAIYLACDPDREGEAICWHLLEQTKPPPKTPVYRVTFNAITQSAVLAALAVPHALDTHLVEAQQARRIIDRLTGYLATSLVSRALNGRYSAGRVQSVGLRIVVDREREIHAFKPASFWTLEAEFKTDQETLRAGLARVKGVPTPRPTEDQAESLIRHLTGTTWWVDKFERRIQYAKPPPPFTTASLLQAASKLLGFTPDEAMQIAQILYEDGLITYMRTDGLHLAPEAQDAARQTIREQFGATYVPEVPSNYSQQVANAQEAHEAIRPVDMARQTLGVEGKGAALYHLIWQRFMASQMTNAQYEQTTVTVGVGRSRATALPIEFVAHGRTLVFDGFQKAYREPTGENESDSDHPLPNLIEGQTLEFVQWHKSQGETRPPARYTEAGLVQALETHGIGRPSTYAPTVKLLQDRGYVQRDGKHLIPTVDGLKLYDFLSIHFVRLVDMGFTARLEAMLDLVASGQATRLKTIQHFWMEFAPGLKSAGAVLHATAQKSTGSIKGDSA